MSRDDRALLLRLVEETTARLDAGALAAGALAAVPPRARVLGLGKVAHLQVRAALEARPDLVPLLSISAEACGGADADPARRGRAPWELEGDHPLPGARSFVAGARLLEAARGADGAPILFLLSGGGSALATAPAPGLSDADKLRAYELLLGAGLDIGHMNVVRKRLSALKGGRLARAAPRSSWHLLVLSDVVGDSLEAIASGPCTADEAPAGEARRICEEAGLWAALPPAVRRHLEAHDAPVSLAGVDVRPRILAGAESLARTAASLSPVEATALPPVTGSVTDCARRYAAFARSHAGKGPALLVAAGEPMLRVEGDGRGGRAQHLALLMARELAGWPATFLAVGTDGRDGATGHAGAVVDGSTAAAAGAALEAAIARFDSATLHARLGTAVPSTPPRTHLGELHLTLVR